MEAAIVLGTYAITLTLTESDGPFGLMRKLRKQKWMDNFGLLNCHLCTSFWVALALSLAFGRPIIILVAWGLSVLIDKIIVMLSLRVNR